MNENEVLQKKNLAGNHIENNNEHISFWSRFESELKRIRKGNRSPSEE